MAVYLLDKITKDVRVALDQNMSSQTLELIGDVDTLAINELICSKIVEAVKRVHSQAPVHLLEGRPFGDAIYWKEHESGWVLLPEDFMRLVVFEMDDWERPCIAAFSMDDPEYALQSSRFKGIRGTAQRPVCFLVIRPEGRVLEFYSCKSTDAQVHRALYMPYPRVDENRGIDVSGRCYDAVVYTTASLVLATFGDNKSETLSGLAESALI